VCSALWLSACKSPPPPPPEPPKKPTGLFEWNGDNKKAISNIVINVDDQKAYLYQGEDQVGWTYVATGISSFPTPTGDFKVLEKVQNKVSNLYGKAYTAEGKLSNSDFKIGRDLVPAGGRFAPAKMPYFMRLTGDGVGMHIGPIPRPGRRASHGCIRMPAKMAPIVFNHISIGTPVSITGSGPDYQTYLKQAAKKSHQNAAKLAAATKKAAEEKASADAAAGIVPPVGEPATAPGTVTAAPGAPTPSSTTPATASPATTTPAAAPGSATVTTLPVNKPSFLPPTDVVRPALPATPPKEPNQ
jgi:hypothetical protein